MLFYDPCIFYMSVHNFSNGCFWADIQLLCGKKVFMVNCTLLQYPKNVEFNMEWNCAKMKMDPSNRTCFSRKLGIVYKEKYVLMFCKKTNMHKKFHSLTNVICMTIELLKYQTFSALSRWSLVIFDLQKPTGN